MARFIKNIQNFSAQYSLWEKGSKILVGVSGGPDSVCLLDVLSFLAKKYDFELQIAHVNYGLRGQDSRDDEKLIKELGKKYKLKVNILRPRKDLYKGNIENSLRNVRYAYFEDLRNKLQFDFIAVAHNQNDQAETVLMKMLRGTGLNGLAAMRPKSTSVIRPLLQITKVEILAYLKEKNLTYRMDKSNQQLDILRNKVRHEVIPYFEKKFNAAIVKNLSDLAYSVADDYDFIQKNAERFALSVCMDKQACFFDNDFLVLHESVQRQALRQIFLKLQGQFADIEYSHIEEIRKVIKSGKNKTKIANIGGLKISKKGAKIEIFC